MWTGKGGLAPRNSVFPQTGQHLFSPLEQAVDLFTTAHTTTAAAAVVAAAAGFATAWACTAACSAVAAGALTLAACPCQQTTGESLTAAQQSTRKTATGGKQPPLQCSGIGTHHAWPLHQHCLSHPPALRVTLGRGGGRHKTADMARPSILCFVEPTTLWAPNFESAMRSLSVGATYLTTKRAIWNTLGLHAELMACQFSTFFGRFVMNLLPCLVLSHLPWPHTNSRNEVLHLLVHPRSLRSKRACVPKGGSGLE